MPRYSFGKEKKKMPKTKSGQKSSASPSKSTTSSSSRRSTRSRPAPTPTPTKNKTNDEDGSKSISKTPASILRSNKFGVEVKRTARADDGFADDAPFWDAAKQALTQEGRDEDEDDISSEEEKEEEVEGKISDPAELKKKEKQKKKVAQVEAARQKYEKDQASIKPDFKVAGTLSEESSDERGSPSKNKEDENKEWLQKKWREKNERIRRGAQPGIFSPSDLSRASTIPPTPNVNSTPKSAMKSKLAIDDEENDDFNENGDDHMSVQSNDVSDPGNKSIESLSPIREEIVAKQSRFPKEKEPLENDVEELEEEIGDVVDSLNEHDNLSTNASNEVSNEPEQSTQQPDDYSDGGDDDHGGFELADEPSSPSSPSSPPRQSPAQKSPTHKSPLQEMESGSPELNVDSNDNQSIADSVQSNISNGSEQKIDSSPELNEENDENDENDDVSENSPKIDSKSKKSKKKKLAESITPKRKKTKKKRGRLKKVRISSKSNNVGYPAGNREYKTIPASEFEVDDDDGQVRRSKRRKFPPLAYWKNEKVVYEKNQEEGYLAEVYGDMAMVAGIQHAEPTPYKKREVKQRVYSDDEDDDSDGKKKNMSTKVRNDSEIKPFDSKKLRKKYNIKGGDSAQIWSDSRGVALEKRVIWERNKVDLHDLPLTKKRKKGEGKVVARAAQAFNIEPEGTNIPGYIGGCMELPPLGIKDEEGVGPCSQMFFVCDCQPEALEVAFADPNVDGGNFDAETAQRFLLSKGGIFHIPAGNVYRIQNHSKRVDCILHWTIIRPAPEQPDQEEE